LLDLLYGGTSQDTIIFTYQESPTLAWRYVRSQGIVKAIKEAIHSTDTNCGYSKNKVSSQSLLLVGAMAIFIDVFTLIGMVLFPSSIL